MATRGPTNGVRREEAVRKREGDWRRIFAEQRSSGLNHSAFCRQKAISPNAYFWWKRELPRRHRLRRGTRAHGKKPAAAKRSSAPALVPVRIRTEERSITAGFLQFFEVLLGGGRVLRVPVGFHAEELRRLLLVLEGEAC